MAHFSPGSTGLEGQAHASVMAFQPTNAAAMWLPIHHNLMRLQEWTHCCGAAAVQAPKES